MLLCICFVAVALAMRRLWHPLNYFRPNTIPTPSNPPLLLITNGEEGSQVNDGSLNKAPIYNIPSTAITHITEYLTMEDMHSVSKLSQAGAKVHGKQLEVSKSTDAYLDQFDRIPMLAANGCMLGLHFTPGMTMESCLLDIVDPRSKILGARRRFTNRQLDTLILSSINAENVEALKILLKVRFSRNDRKIAALVSRNDKALQYCYFWAGIQNETPPEVRQEIFEALESAPRTIGSLDLPLEQQIILFNSASSFLENFWKSFFNKDLNNVRIMLRDAPFILFGDGSIVSPDISVPTFAVQISKRAATTDSNSVRTSTFMHHTIFENGFVPYFPMFDFLMKSGDIDQFEVYLRFAPSKSMVEWLISSAATGNHSDFLGVLLDHGEQERLSQEKVQNLIEDASKYGNFGVINVLIARHYRFTFEIPLVLAENCRYASYAQYYPGEILREHQKACEETLKVLNSQLRLIT